MSRSPGPQAPVAKRPFYSLERLETGKLLTDGKYGKCPTGRVGGLWRGRCAGRKVEEGEGKLLEKLGPPTKTNGQLRPAYRDDSHLGIFAINVNKTNSPEWPLPACFPSRATPPSSQAAPAASARPLPLPSPKPAPT